jgi:hypothetical protein
LIFTAVFVRSELFGGLHRHTATLTNFRFHIRLLLNFMTQKYSASVLNRLSILAFSGDKGMPGINALASFETKHTEKATERDI